MVLLHRYCNVIVSISLESCNLSNNFVDIQSGHPAAQVSVYPVSKFLRNLNNHTGCGNGSSCSGSTVAVLVFYAVFSYLWTSQVIGNVALATLAGGAYGSEFSLTS